MIVFNPCPMPITSPFTPWRAFFPASVKSVFPIIWTRDGHSSFAQAITWRRSWSSCHWARSWVFPGFLSISFISSWWTFLASVCIFCSCLSYSLLTVSPPNIPTSPSTVHEMRFLDSLRDVFIIFVCSSSRCTEDSRDHDIFGVWMYYLLHKAYLIVKYFANFHPYFLSFIFWWIFLFKLKNRIEIYRFYL